MTIDDIAYAEDFDDIVIGEEADRKPYTILPPGVYPFSIDEPVQRERYSGSDKIPQCWKATVKLKVDGGAAGTATVFYNLFLTQNRSWAIKELFVGVGLVPSDVQGEWSPPWNKLPGTVGAVEIDNQEYKGKTYNNVKKILDPAEAAEAIGGAMATTMTAPAAPVASQPTFNYPR